LDLVQESGSVLEKTMVGTNGVLMVNDVAWANTPATKRVTEVIERRANFITTVTSAGGTSKGKSLLPSWESKQQRPGEGFISHDEFVIYFIYTQTGKNKYRGFPSLETELNNFICHLYHPQSHDLSCSSPKE
jgi:hypothetical protein